MLKQNYYRMIRKQRKQIVILLGAGAALPWKGISTQELNDIFIADTTFQTKSGVNVGKFLFDVINNFYGSASANFETIIAALETIQNYIISSTNEGHINTSNTSFTPAILQLKDIIENDLFLSDDVEEKRIHIYNLFSHYINLVIYEIEKYNNNVLDDKYQVLNSNLIRLVKYYLSHGFYIKFYTLNYDNLVPQIVSPHFKMHEGLYNSSINYKKFNFDLNRFRSARLSHFNIHGSIFLNHIFTGLEYETVYHDYPQNLSVVALEIKAGNPSEKLIYSPLVIGYNKTQRISNKPFNLGYNAFANDCNDCTALLTVGYSFSDPHINSILSTFTKWDRAKLMCVTKLDSDFYRSSLERLIDYNIVPINPGVDDKTWFHENGDQKHVYKLGFEEFLKDKQNWSFLLPTKK